MKKAQRDQSTVESIEKERQRLNDNRQRLMNELAGMIRSLSFE